MGDLFQRHLPKGGASLCAQAGIGQHPGGKSARAESAQSAPGERLLA